MEQKFNAIMKVAALSFIVLIAFPAFSAGSEKLSSRLFSSLSHLDSNTPLPVWVFFSDKGRYESLGRNVPRDVVSGRSLQRRRKVRAENDLVSYTDLPIDPSYVDALTAQGILVRQRSKWFNAVSVSATAEQTRLIASLPFVASLDVVTRFKRNQSEDELRSDTPHQSLLARGEARIDTLQYGPSFAQLNQINIVALHNAGNYGQGVIIGSFDNGFRLLTHETFDTIRPRIIATYDFVDHKVSVVPNNPDPSFGAHGILTLSALAGYTPGQLIGPAFGASYILARTENDSSETPVEEDNWLAAIEWADSIGVDVTTTSLGYLGYDPPYPSWTWEDMDGNTTLITRAADMAVGLGIVVCNSAGNNGSNPSHNTLNAPADGDSVLSIGAVNPDGTRASFSSVGPTTSTPPRIKPDVMAQGVSVRCASPTDPHQYTYAGGTSLSCPLAAGAVALILHAVPTATPMQIGNALRQMASQSGSPDNLMGWGIINTVATINTLTGVSGNRSAPSSFSLLQNYPNPFNPSTTIRIGLPEAADVTLVVYDLLGREVRTLVNGNLAAGDHEIVWNGINNAGSPAPTGVYFYRMTANGRAGHLMADTKKLTIIR